MKQRRRAKTELEMLASFPITTTLAGWYFRVRETSAGAVVAEGSDRWGRQVSRRGPDEDEALRRCVADAQSIAAQIGSDEATS